MWQFSSLIMSWVKLELEVTVKFGCINFSFARILRLRPRMFNTSLQDQPSRIAKKMLDGIQMAGIIIIIVLVHLRNSCNKCTAVFILISFRKCQYLGYATDATSKCATNNTAKPSGDPQISTHHQGRKLSHIGIRCWVLNYLRSDRIKLHTQAKICS